MYYYELPQDMQEEVKKLTSEHFINIEQVTEYYMMSGEYEHTDYLCSLADRGFPDYYIELANQMYWKEKNEKIFQELNKL